MDGFMPWRARWEIRKYKAESALVIARERLEPYEVLEFEGNIALRVGVALAWNLIIGGSANHFANGSCSIGVGNSSTTAVDTQTDLQGGSTYWQAADSGYPTRTTTTFTNDTFHCVSTFPDGVAEFEWLEIAVKETAGGVLLNRKVISAGTKTSGNSWAADLKISWPTS